MISSRLTDGWISEGSYRQHRTDHAMPARCWLGGSLGTDGQFDQIFFVFEWPVALATHEGHARAGLQARHFRPRGDRCRQGARDCTQWGVGPGAPRATNDEAGPVERVYPVGSFGDGYQRAMNLRAAERKAKGKDQSKEQEKRDDWPRAWKWLEIFAECDPRTIQPEHFLAIDPKTGKATGLVPEESRPRYRRPSGIGPSKFFARPGRKWRQ